MRVDRLVCQDLLVPPHIFAKQLCLCIILWQRTNLRGRRPGSCHHHNNIIISVWIIISIPTLTMIFIRPSTQAFFRQAANRSYTIARASRGGTRCDVLPPYTSLPIYSSDYLTPCPIRRGFADANGTGSPWEKFTMAPLDPIIGLTEVCHFLTALMVSSITTIFLNKNISIHFFSHRHTCRMNSPTRSMWV